MDVMLMMPIGQIKAAGYTSMERSELEITLGVVNIERAFKAMEVHEITKRMTRKNRALYQ